MIKSNILKRAARIIIFSLFLSLSCTSNTTDSYSYEVNIPFAGNSYVTQPLGSDLIDNYTGTFKYGWDDNNIVISTYFRVGASGELNIGFTGRNTTGTSKVRFTIDGKSYDVKLSESSYRFHNLTTIKKQTPGYVKIDIQGVSKTGSTFGEILSFSIGGTAAQSTNHYVTEEKIKEESSNCYFFRRGASVHFFYPLPEEDVTYFYNEITVPEESAVNNTYFMMNGFSEGYMGIQQLGNGERKVLFSVWSPYSTDNPEEIPEDQRIKLIRKGKDVTVGEFGNEGSGGQSWLHYSWQPGETYKALVGVEPDGKGNTTYTAYFYADNEWKLIAAFSRPKTDTHYTGAYSFLENFNPTHSIIPRSVHFTNQWVKLTSGEWIELTNARFSIDNTGRQGMRHDLYGKYSENLNSFMLRSFGFFDEHTEFGTTFNRKPTPSGAPDIDIDKLESIPSQQ